MVLHHCARDLQLSALHLMNDHACDLFEKSRPGGSGEWECRYGRGGRVRLTMQHWQSSPHQHGSLTPGVFGVVLMDDVLEDAETEVVVERVEVVLGAGIVGSRLSGC